MELLVTVVIIVVIVAVIVYFADQLPHPVGMVVKYAVVAIAIIALLYLLLGLFRGAGIDVPN